MAFIKKMRMKGFKSFAAPLDLEFGQDFNCVLGPNGSGKCLCYNELVQLSDGSLVKIGDLVENKLKSNNYKKIDDGYVIKGDDTEILSLNTNSLKISPKKIHAFVKRTSPEHLIKIKTRSGREITSTEYHPLFILKNEVVRSIRADELKEGIKIAVARKIPINTKTKYFCELIELIDKKDNVYVPYSEDFYKLLLKLKKTTWKSLSSELEIPYNSIKGLLDKQAINFYHLIKILRKGNLTDNEIINLIPKIKSKNKPNLYKMPWKNSKEFARFFGYLLAEGRITKSNQIWFTNGSEEIVSDYADLIKNLFEIKPSINEYKPNCWDILIYSSPLIKVLEKFGMSNGVTAEKNITNLFLKHSDNQELCEVLNGLYCGDGHVSKNSIEIITKSKKLGFAIENILSKLGIIYSSSYVVKIATNSGFSRIYRRIFIYGVDNFIKFHNNINLIHNEKRKRLNNLVGLKSNPNLDLIETNNLIKNVAKELKLNIKKLTKKFPRLGAYCYNNCTPSVTGVKYLIENVFEPASNKNSCLILSKLKTLAVSDVYWDEIISLEKIKSNEKWVYDLSVEENHNFIANNIIVHNSNIMDALCFVLGEISAKSMRAEKSANLIFNGGKKGSPAKEAEVSIYFDNGSGRFAVKDKEIKITRIVRQKGTSVYKLNDEARTRQEIRELLGKAGIGASGHNIILQGDIVHFMEMKSDERRKIIEDVSGISVYEEKKHQTMNELNNVEQKLNEVSIVMKEREAHLRELKKDRDQALKYKEYERKLKENKATVLHIQIKGKNNEKENIEKKISKEQGEINKVNLKISDVRKNILLNKEKLGVINKDIEEKGEKEQIVLQKEVECLKTNIAKDSVRLDGLKNEVLKLKLRKEQIIKEQGEVKEKISCLEEQKKKLESDMKKFSKDEKDAVRQIKCLKEKHGLFDSVENLNLQISVKQEEIFSLKEKKQELSFGCDNLKNEISKIDSLLNLENDPKIKKNISELKKIDNSLENELAKLSVNNSCLKESKNKLDCCNIEFNKLNERQVSLGIYDGSIKKILGMKKKGVYGTVSQLGKVDSKYALALEVAAGARIKSVVVSDDKIAIDCIKELKRNRLGVVTFLPLNKIRARERYGGELLKKEGVIGFAVDLVKHDVKFKDVFSFVFGNTLIVKDSGVARRLGIGRARMVALDGDVFEMSGAIIGGYRRKSGSFNEIGLDAKISVLEKEISELKENVSLLGKDILSGEDVCRKLREEKAILEAEILKVQKTTEVKDIGKLKKEKVKLVSDLSETEKNIKELDKNLYLFVKEINNLKIKRDKMSKVDSSVTGNLQSLEDSRLEISKKVVGVQGEIKSLVTQIFIVYKPELDKISMILKGNEKEFSEFSKELVILEENIKNDGLNLKIKEKEEKKFQSDYKNLFIKRNKLNDDISKLENGISKDDFKVREIEKKVNEINLKRAKIVGELEGLEAEFLEFKDEKIRRNVSFDDLKTEIYRFERFMRDMGNVNLRALEVYDKLFEEYGKLGEKIDKLKSEKEDVLKMMVEIEKNKKKLFMKTFKIINENFKSIFVNLSEKGEAYLELDNKDNPFEGGLNIRVRLLGNKFLDIKSLSGGEKTMTALSFIFAIQEFNPASFYLLDEVDAALDKTNSSMLSKLIKKYSKNAQYILISHNDNVITEADQIYGVSMQRNGISKVVSLKV